MAHEVSFQPSYDQFVLYDPDAPLDPEEATLWYFPAESDRGLSVRKTELAVLAVDERDWIVTTFISISVFPDPTQPPPGDWTTSFEATLTLASGVLAVGDIILMETPVLRVPVPPGRVHLRIVGRPNPEVGLSYVIQVWPEN